MTAAMSANGDIDQCHHMATLVTPCVCGHPAAWHGPACIGCGCAAMSGREGR